MSEDNRDDSTQMESGQLPYRKIREIGAGSFGIAYEVEHVEEGTRWVAKEITLENLPPGAALQFFQEAKILEAMKHPQIIELKEFYRTKSEKLVLILEFAEGGDLANQIEERISSNTKFEENVIVDWMLQLLMALKYSHDSNLLHRDLKAENVFLSKSLEVKLGDFGTAQFNKMMQSQIGTVNRDDNFVGTPLYSSPEVISENKFSEKSDAWALGVLLYQLCNFKLPFLEKSYRRIIQSILEKHPAPIDASYSQQLRSTIFSLLKKDPEQRASVSDLLEQNWIRAKMAEFNQNKIQKLKDVDSLNLKLSDKSLKNDFEKCRFYKNSNFINPKDLEELKERMEQDESTLEMAESLVIDNKNDAVMGQNLNQDDINWLRERMSVAGSVHSNGKFVFKKPLEVSKTDFKSGFKSFESSELMTSDSESFKKSQRDSIFQSDPDQFFVKQNGLASSLHFSCIPSQNQDNKKQSLNFSHHPQAQKISSDTESNRNGGKKSNPLGESYMMKSKQISSEIMDDLQQSSVLMVSDVFIESDSESAKMINCLKNDLMEKQNSEAQSKVQNRKEMMKIFRDNQKKTQKEADKEKEKLMSEAMTMAGSLNQSTLATTEPTAPKKRLTFLETHNESLVEADDEFKEDTLQTTCGKIEKRFSRFSVYNQGIQLENLETRNLIMKRKNTEIEEEDESCFSDTYERSNSNFFDQEESKFHFQNHSLYRQKVENKIDQSNLPTLQKSGAKDTLITIKRPTASGVSNISQLEKSDVQSQKDDTLSNSNPPSHLSEQEILLFSRSNLSSSTVGTTSNTNNRKSILSAGFRLSIMKEDLIQSRFQEELLNKALQSMSKSSLETSLLKSGLFRNEFGKSLIKMESDEDFKQHNTQTYESRTSDQYSNYKSRLSELQIDTEGLTQLQMSKSPKNRLRSPAHISPPKLSTIQEKTAELNPSQNSSLKSLESNPSQSSNSGTSNQAQVLSKADQFLMKNSPSQNVFLKKSKQKVEEIGYRDSTDINNTDHKSIINFYNHWKLQEEAAKQQHQQLNGKIEENNKRFHDFDDADKMNTQEGRKRAKKEFGQNEMRNRLHSLISNTPSRDSRDFDIFNAEFDSSMVDSSGKSKESRNTLHSFSSRNSGSVQQKINTGFNNLLSETNRSQSDGNKSFKLCGTQTQFSDRDSLFGGNMSLLSKGSMGSGFLIQQNSLISKSSKDNERISVLADKVLNHSNRNSIQYDKNFKKKLSIQSRHKTPPGQSTCKHSNIPKLRSQFSDNLSGRKAPDFETKASFTIDNSKNQNSVNNTRTREQNMFLYGYPAAHGGVEDSGSKEMAPAHCTKEIIKTFHQNNFRGSLLIINKSGSSSKQEKRKEEEDEEEEEERGSQLLIVKKKGGGLAKLKSDQDMTEDGEILLKNDITERASKPTDQKTEGIKAQNIESLIRENKPNVAQQKIKDNQKTIFDVNKDFPDSSENYLSNIYRFE